MLVPDDRARAAALQHVPRALPTSPSRRDDLALPQPRSSEEVLADFAEGKVDILIGTHRAAVARRDSEEPRARHPRRGAALRRRAQGAAPPLRLEVDVLALSATPIPRTLHMSLAGLRDISRHRDAAGGPARDPHVRAASTTRSWSEALRREHGRGGQCSSSTTGSRRSRRPRASCSSCARSADPRRARADDESASSRPMMLDFLRGDVTCSCSTTIIESGLDIPQANTLIVERADLLGLAQLYQIRGRVGRSASRRTPICFIPTPRELTAEARARLTRRRPHRARRRLRDRDARPRDPRRGRPARRRAVGHVAAVGFELYVELLNEAVAELSGERRPPARPSASMRGGRLRPRGLHPGRGAQDRPAPPARARGDRGRAGELHAATEDRYGPLPEPVENLFSIQEAKLEAGADRRRLPRLPQRPRDSGPAGARLPGVGRTCAGASTPRSTRRRSAKSRSGRTR